MRTLMHYEGYCLGLVGYYQVPDKNYYIPPPPEKNDPSLIETSVIENSFYILSSFVSYTVS